MIIGFILGYSLGCIMTSLFYIKLANIFKDMNI